MSKYEWNEREMEFFRSINTPAKIQEFLNNLKYDDQVECRSPRYVILENKAHCFEGALLAAAALEQIGHPPVVIDLLAEKGKDDDHIVAVYRMKINGRTYLGAIAKTNTTTLAGRDPVYRDLHELVMSYYDGYCNTVGERTLRAYSSQVNLRKFDDIGWRTTEEDLQPTIGRHLTDVVHKPLIHQDILPYVSSVPQKQLTGIFLGANEAGLFKI